MKRLGEYRSYLLYEVEEQDGRDINTSSGSRYIRNSILIFEPDENNPKLGDEWRMCKNANSRANETGRGTKPGESGGNGHSAQSRYRGRTQTERTARGSLLS